MWILPKQLHISAFVLDTAVLNLDLNESSQLCAQSLFVRSKLSPVQTWSQKWKRDSWTQHLFGRILKPSLGQSFLGWWTSSLAATLVSHSAVQESDSAQKTPDIFGLSSQMELGLCDHESVSLKTLKDTFPWGCATSCASWDIWVTERRGEYSRRLKSARLTRESACSSWPTAAARDYKGTSPGYLYRADGKSRVDQLPVAVDQAEAGNWPTPTVQEAGKIGNQANHGQLALSNHPALRGDVTREKFEKGKHGQAAPANLSTHGSRPESWATPRTGIRAETHCSYDRGKSNIEEQAGASVKGNGKLNPRWVETLMGLPVGWTMPSCQSLVTTALTSCASSGTELCQQPQS